MKAKMNLNVIESNQNIVYPADEIEKGLNLVGHADGSQLLGNVKNLFYLLEKSRSRIFRNHELKQGLIYLFMGDYYLQKKEFQFARFALEIAQELLANHKSFTGGVEKRFERLQDEENEEF